MELTAAAWRSATNVNPLNNVTPKLVGMFPDFPINCAHLRNPVSLPDHPVMSSRPPVWMSGTAARRVAMLDVASDGTRDITHGHVVHKWLEY